MTSGHAVNRQLIVVLNDGTPVLEWGDGLGVDLFRGEFFRFPEGEQPYPVQDDELEMLRKAGRVLRYDQWQVVVTSLPESPVQPIG
jgi:hypothetical protein